MTEQSTSPGSPHSRRVQSPRDIALSRPLPERVSWEELGPEFFGAWGYPHGEFMPEHLAIYGPTGSGKSYFEKYILMERARLRGSAVVVVATKPADATLSSTGWPVVDRWPPKTGWSRKKRDYRQVIYWAKAGGLDVAARARQAAAVEDLLSKLWRPNSNRILAFDELAYVEKQLKLSTHVETYFREARSLGITIVATTQRPTGVTRWMHSEPGWAVFFKPKDEEDAERLAQVAGNKLYYRRVFDEINKAQYEFVLVHSLTGESYISSLPKNARPVRIANARSEAPKKRDAMA